MDKFILDCEEYKGQSVNNLCRTCLKILDLEESNFHAFEPYLDQLFNLLLHPETTNTTFGEDLPPNLCEICFKKLQDVYNFQNRCKETLLNFQILIQNNILIPLVKLEETFSGDADFSDLDDKDFKDPLQTVEEDENVVNIHMLSKKPTKPRRTRLKRKDPSTNASVGNIQENSQETNKLEIVINPPVEDIKAEKEYLTEKLEIKIEEKYGNISSADDNEEADITYQSQDDDSESEFSEKDTTDDKNRKKKEKRSKKPSKFKCDECPKTFYIEFRYKAHMREHMGLIPFECPHCESGFSTYDSYKAHIKELHENVGVVYKCTESGCSKTYTRHFSLQGHLRQKHADKYGNKKPFMCEECGKTFVHKSALTLHMYSHNEKEKPFPCEQCQKRFTSKSALNQHMLRHTGEKNFMCPYCGLQKYNKTDLKLHINYHTKERQWPCKYPGCSYVGNRSSAIGRHVRGVHEQIKNYQCKFCDRKFNKKETMKHHEMTHTGEKPHVCDICGWRFIQAIALKKHRETHSRSRSQGV